MRAAIIGANGYIARNMLAVNRVSKYAETVPSGHRPEHVDGATGYRMADLSRRADAERAIEDCDVIFFFAGKTGTIQGFDAPDEFLDTNERLLLHLLDAYRSVGSKAKIVFPSTRLVYRGSDDPLREEAQKEFLTPYAMQKYACEQYLEMYRRQYGVRYCVLRICVPYGTLVHPLSSYGTLDFFLRQARETGRITIYGDGSQRRTVTYIGDLCHMIWQAGLDDRCINDVYNVGGENMSLRELAEQVAKAISADVVEVPWPEAIRKIESGSTVFDADKLNGILHYRENMTVERWIKEMVMTKLEESPNPGGVQCNYCVATVLPICMVCLREMRQ